MTFRHFLKPNRRLLIATEEIHPDRIHVREGALEIYIRRHPRHVGGKIYDTLTIADFWMVDYSDEEEAFKAWFEDAEKVARELKLTILFENAGGWSWMNKFLAEHQFQRIDDPSIVKTQLDAYRPHQEEL